MQGDAIMEKSDALRNGSIGIFKGVRDDALLVSFEGVVVVEVKRKTWIKRNHAGVPISKCLSISSYSSIRCHVSQGLTLPAAVIHCSTEYVPGLIYVAVSRVKSPDCVQVLNFSVNQLLPPSNNVIQLCSTINTKEPCADLTCCSQQECLDEKCFTVIDRFCAYEDDVDDNLYFVCTKQECCDLLEENVITPFAKLEQSTHYPETLQITEGRQYRERGLLHITDDTTTSS